MRIGYFGGSFDPPHRGHLAVALSAADAFALDRVLLSPAGRQPLKAAGASACYADRLAMVELLCRQSGDPRLSASRLDAPLPGEAPNFTVDTLGHLCEEQPAGARLYSIVGADAFLTLPQWHQPERLLQLCEWIVVSRPGCSREEVERLARRLSPTPVAAEGAEVEAAAPRVHWLGGVAEPASATRLRSGLEHGESEAAWRALLPEAVFDYVRAHHLYQQRA